VVRSSAERGYVVVGSPIHHAGRRSAVSLVPNLPDAPTKFRNFVGVSGTPCGKSDTRFAVGQNISTGLKNEAAGRKPG
jgi:hypothetical protein